MDSDPTPGDPEQVRGLADELQTFSDDVAEALGKVRGLASDRAVRDWAGLSAEAFRSEFDGVPGNLEKLRDSYDLCAQALQTYWPKLQTAQGQADRALDRAIAAQADLTSAQGALGDAQGWVSRAGEEAERLQREGERAGAPPPDEAEVRAATRDRQAADEAQEAAQARVDTAQESLDAARELARQAKEMREEAARQAARDIDEASDAGIQNRKWWQKAVHWVTENWDTIVDICKIVVAVLGVVVMIIGGPLAWVVLAAALVVLADTLIKYARGEAGLLDVAFAALDCIPGMKGLTTLGGLARGLRGGLTAARTGLRGMAQGAAGLGRQVRGRAVQMVRRNGCGDPVDVATGELIMSFTDVSLPGVLPLVVERHHISAYRDGRLFGPSWASTLDQRLLLGETGVRFFTADGMALEYPVPLPDPGTPVLPVEGPRWELSWDGTPDGALLVHQPESRRTLHFLPVPGAPARELPLVAVTDTNGNRVDIPHGPDGTPTGLVHSGGYHVRVKTTDGRVSALRLDDGPGSVLLTTYDYDDAGNLAAIRNSSGLPLRLGYDDADRLTRWEDRNGTWYAYTYDAAGRCVFTTGTDRALEYRYTYDDGQRRTTAEDAAGARTVFQFDDSFRLVAVTDPLGHTVHREHDRYDRLVAETDPLGRTTAFAHDDAGQVVTITRPDGRTVRAAYGELGLPTEVFQADGTVLRHAYDGAGNRVALVDGAGRRTRFAYDAHGGLAGITDALGTTTRVRCDAAGLPVAVTDPLGETVTFRRDAFGRVVERTDPLGAAHRATYTVEGGILSLTDPLGATHTWTYDPEGNRLSDTDALGRTTRYEYGAFDLPTARVGPDGTRHTIERDHGLRVTRVTGPDGLNWDYRYDAAGRPVSETDFGGRTVQFTLDAAGDLVARTNAAGQTVTYERDALRQVVAVSADGVPVSTRAYDPLGRVLRATTPDTELTVHRDPSGLPVSETVNGRTITYAYDDAGRPVARTTPSGHRSSWTFDAAGRQDTLVTGGHSLTFAYDAQGRETHRDVGGGVEITWTVDAAGRRTAETVHAIGHPHRRRAWTYLPDHSPASLSGPDGETTRFGFDAAGRITAVTGPHGVETYTYDAAGELVAAEWPAPGTGTPVRRAGRLRDTYDAAGRLVRRLRRRLSRKPESWRYEWDAQDRLVRVVTPDGTVWRYIYDAFGRRIAKQRLGDDGATVAEETAFTWSGTTPVEQDGTDGTSLTWDWRGHHVVGQHERRVSRDSPQEEIDRRFVAIVTDLVGTPSQVLDEDGATVWEDSGTLWGVPRDAAPPPVPLRFPGQYHDQESGLHYNYARYYDPETARYLSPDPLGLLPSPSAYAYVVNPLTWIDPLGLAAHPDVVPLYHGTQDFRGSQFTLHVPDDVARRGYTPESGIYLTNNPMRAINQYAAGPGGMVIRVEVPLDFAQRIGRTGPGDTPDPEWFVNTQAGVDMLNQGNPEVLSNMDAMTAFFDGTWQDQYPADLLPRRA
ncbi:RHS repeat-associated core domain-containing protein [Streptomyces sp. NPDC049881]|uniref:RHS repeat-associated core domain-containing protein n=1 Tax=Streptomyces sp. NPDC049881 TaxID=3155778 RepID=UPI0034210DD6